MVPSDTPIFSKSNAAINDQLFELVCINLRKIVLIISLIDIGIVWEFSDMLTQKLLLLSALR